MKTSAQKSKMVQTESKFEEMRQNLKGDIWKDIGKFKVIDLNQKTPKCVLVSYSIVICRSLEPQE